MSDFSLELTSKKINNNKTKDYFKEVLSSYQLGNYRSAVVMLWSVAVCDILYKLQYLVDVYEDPQATTLLKNIEKHQRDNPKSSSWEATLINDIKGTSLINESEYQNLEYLQKQRHLAAHPILNQENTLLAPNKETTRGLIRNTLESLLIKPPLYAKKVLDIFLSDLSKISTSDLILDEEKLKNLIQDKYLKHMTPAIQLAIFRPLWKFTFKLSEEDDNQNRDVNFLALLILQRENSSLITQDITDKQDYYSDNIAINGTPIISLVKFLSLNPAIYKQLNTGAKTKIDGLITKNLDAKIMASFTKESLSEHLQEIKKEMTTDEICSNYNDAKASTWKRLSTLCEIEDDKKNFHEILIIHYTNSGNYNSADRLFKCCILPFINIFSIQSLKLLLEKSEKNDQMYTRKQSSDDYKLICDRLITLGIKNFDIKMYPNQKEKLQKAFDPIST